MQFYHTGASHINEEREWRSIYLTGRSGEVKLSVAFLDCVLLRKCLQVVAVIQGTQHPTNKRLINLESPYVDIANL